MGPLAGLKIVEFAGLGPAPMCAMLLADLGASVMRIDRTQTVELGRKRPAHLNLLNRNRETLALDLKTPAGVEVALEMIASSDALIEGFRPGVMERLGLGPDVCLQRSPGLVYGRMTGFGQEGPLAQAAGHDLNFISLTGALDSFGRPGQPPTQPLNLVGDFGGGSLYLALGILAALFEARTSGKGQVVDAAIVDGALSLLTMQFGDLAASLWRNPRTEAVAPFYYEVYQCADGKWISVAPAEERFLVILLAKLQLDPALARGRHDRAQWKEAHDALAGRFREHPQDHWRALLEGTDCCFAPVLALDEVAGHPHMAARGAIVEVDGVPQPAPAPRFSRSVTQTPRAPRASSRQDALKSLELWLGPARYAELDASGAVNAVDGTHTQFGQ